MPEKLEASYRQEKRSCKEEGERRGSIARVIRNVDWHFSPICDKVFTFNALLQSYDTNSNFMIKRAIYRGI